MVVLEQLKTENVTEIWVRKDDKHILRNVNETSELSICVQTGLNYVSEYKFICFWKTRTKYHVCVAKKMTDR